MIRQLQGAAFHSTRKKRRVRGLKFQHTTKESTMDSGSQVHKIVAMPGDGIGKEVMPEGLRVLDAHRGASASSLRLTTSTGGAASTT
jgi:hypothetical protein